MKKRVLYVEDDPRNMSYVSRIVQNEGHELIEAESGEVGWEKVINERPDLVLMDLRLPGELDGIELTRRIKAEPALTQIPIVVLTGYGDNPETRAEAEAAGCNGFLHKPASIRKIQEVLREFLGQTKTAQVSLPDNIEEHEPLFAGQPEKHHSYLKRLECSYCRMSYDADQLIRVCVECGRPLLARYDLEKAKSELDRDAIWRRPANLWRFRELLPVRDERYIYTLGEGGKPVIELKRLGRRLGLKHLFLKDEGQNPTGSFKALGLAVAVSRARELGATEFVIPTAGNAGGALAAYAARAGARAHVYMPVDAPEVNSFEVQIVGADLKEIAGLINDAGRIAAAMAVERGWFDVSTLKEPYRLEGKKIMGYELAAAFAWKLPDVIIYPTGGGTGLIGIWKAFDEMEELGWIDSRRPRMIAVQSESCAPIVRAFHEGAEEARPWENAKTIASGLRVPVAIGDRLMLAVLRESQGTAVALPDRQIWTARGLLASTEGIFAALEGGATIGALQKLVETREITPHEKVLVINTGNGLKERFLLT
jgi:threonine synthase